MYTLDIESYPNFFLVAFKDDTVINFPTFSKLSDTAIAEIKHLLESVIVTFNGNNYDMPMLAYALSGATVEDLNKLSNTIIEKGQPGWMTYEQSRITPLTVDHIDIKEPTAGVMVSLKIYGGRIHAPRLQDLPLPPDTILTKEDANNIIKYCENDLDTTRLLYDMQTEQFKLRRKMTKTYGTDMRSKSDAQVAEAVFRTELAKRKVYAKRQYTFEKKFSYRKPNWLKCRTPILRRIVDAACEPGLFELSPKNKLVLPDTLNKPFELFGRKYKFGVGGLHSQEKKQAVVPDSDHILFDLDVASYYPSIILGERLFPKHLTNAFLDVYRTIYDERLKAKETGDVEKAYSLKIALNGSFGKFGSEYSFLFAPKLLMQTTITGQLALLMLIEALEHLDHVEIVSANTDGIVIHAHKDQYNNIAQLYTEWELTTGYTLEETYYAGLYSRDVNNYLAVKPDGKAKGKGIFAPPGLMKNPNMNICYKAISDYLTKGIAVEQTIQDCDDIRQFIVVRTVKGGAVWRKEKLGKAIRWYYSTDGESIHYVTNGNKVATSDGAKPVMNLPDALPDDIDYTHYSNATNKILGQIGC